MLQDCGIDQKGFGKKFCRNINYIAIYLIFSYVFGYRGLENINIVNELSIMIAWQAQCQPGYVRSDAWMISNQLDFTAFIFGRITGGRATGIWWCAAHRATVCFNKSYHLFWKLEST